jgi:hypothetical protein
MATSYNQLITDYCEISHALQPMIEARGEHRKRMDAILPKYPRLLQQLRDEGRVDALVELSYAHRKAQSAGFVQTLKGVTLDEQHGAIDYNLLEAKDQLNAFALMARVLRAAGEKSGPEQVRTILPAYRSLLHTLGEQKSPLLGEFWQPQIRAVDSLYGKAWPEFMALTVIGQTGHGEGITYVTSGNHTLKDSVQWVLADHGRQSHNVELLQPAAFFHRYNDVPEALRGFGRASDGNVSATRMYVTLASILADAQPDAACGHFVAPMVRICGLPIDDGAPTTVPLALNNWFGESGRVHVTRHPYNPVWDT